MSQFDLFVKGSPAHCRKGEGPYFAFLTTEWGGSPTSPSVAVYDIDNGLVDVTSTVMPSASATVDGVITDRINLSKFSSASKGKFRIIVTFTNAQYAPAKPALDVWVSD